MYYGQWVAFLVHIETNPPTRVVSQYIEIYGVIFWGKTVITTTFLLQCADDEGVCKRKIGKCK